MMRLNIFRRFWNKLLKMDLWNFKKFLIISWRMTPGENFKKVWIHFSIFSPFKFCVFLHIFARLHVTKLACDIHRGHAMSTCRTSSDSLKCRERCNSVSEHNSNRSESDVSKRIRGCRQQQLCSSHLIRRVKWWWRSSGVSRFHPNWQVANLGRTRNHKWARSDGNFQKDWKKTPNNDCLRPSFEFTFWLSDLLFNPRREKDQ